ncbi:serine/threonine-protein kinase [Streptomyces minutiscleroticus]|uniref:non-specific serine/threonine protein kinase n=1 Tax=Streptomyces minutiscleroticus TaxID=68238 RepID=A0A918NHG7_9ACTN|nr:serine/threonine-protein kinase [Streptomyces minutiscleroticus]GGX67982.1 hypothetical protein GCM10010358_23040 [Streptomyces minutiscleroticus]
MMAEGDNVRVIAGRYRLEDRLGRGGMGVVWRATDRLLGRQVAVKELAVDPSLPADRARQQRERTLREARAVAQLRHPHIIVVHDVVEHDERPYMVMELIEGGSLADRIAADGPVGPAEAARIGVALLGALRAAHTAGVLHRDLKPDNVLIADDGRVVLTDFGIAQVAGATTLTESGSFVGSPEYTAPERMSGFRTGPASDLWSLGALLCTALSGESPFHRDSLSGVLHAVVIDEIRPPAAAAPLLPVVAGLLERDPGRRLGASEAERMLRSYLATGRTPQPPPGRTPGQRNVPRRPPEPLPPLMPPGREGRARPSARSALVAAALVAAVAGAGVSAAALLMREGEGGGRVPTSSPAPSTSAGRTPGATSAPQVSPTPTPAPTVTVTHTPSGPGSGVSAREVPSGYRLAHDPEGFALAVPKGFVRKPRADRTFYVSAGETFRIGVRVTRAEPGGPLAAMRRAHAEGPSAYRGYREGRVTATAYGGSPAALRQFTWDGSLRCEGPRHAYDLSWEVDGRTYELWVSAPADRAREARRHFDVAVASFGAAPAF